MLPTDQARTIAAAGAKFNVDARLIEAVYGKESSFGMNPIGVGATNPFQAFGLIAGPGNYNGTGYRATGNTFQDAAYTAAAYIASTRNDYDQTQKTEPFLQYFDTIYSPPADNPNSLGNLTTIYKTLGGDPAGEAQYSGAQNSPFTGFGDPKNNPIDGIIKNVTGTSPAAAADVGGTIADALGRFQSAANDWVLYATAGGLFLALIGGGIAIMAANSDAGKLAIHTTEKAALAA